jgi:tetratricopeptide (TPR) repeat protein
VRSIAFQLALRWDDYRTRLLPRLGLFAGSGDGQIKEAIETLAKKNLADTFSHLISEPLAGLIWREHKLVILMDALDEATDEAGRNELSALISGRFLELPNWISFVATSRPDASVVGHLQRFKPFEIDAEDERNTADLRRYADQVLRHLSVIGAISKKQAEELCVELVRKSAGMVLYVRMAVEALREGILKADDLKRMDVGLSGLYGKYYAVFEHRFGSQYHTSVQPLIRLLMAAPGPMPLDVAAEVLGCGKEGARRAREALGAYLTENLRGLSLFHKTLGEWLGSQQSGMFYTDSEPAKTELAEFFWKEFVQCYSEDISLTGRSLRWEDLVIAWLPELLSNTAAWNSPDCLSSFGDFLSEKKRYFTELAVRTRNLDLVRKKFGSDSVQYADCLLKNGKTMEQLGHYDDSLEHLEAAVEIYKLKVGPTDSKTGDALNHLALVRFMLADYDEAESLYRETLKIRESNLGSEHPDTAETMAYLAGLLQSTFRLDEAEVLYEKALRITRAALGESHPDSITYLTYVAGIYEEKGRYTESTRLFRQALHMYREVLEPEDTLLSLCIGYVGWGLASASQFAEAEQHYLEALNLQEKILGPEHPYVARTLTYIGDVRLNQMDMLSADRLYQRSLTIRKKVFGEDHPDTARTLMSVAWLEQVQSKIEAAESMYANALDVFESTCGPDSSDACNARNHLATLRLRYRGDIQNAEVLLRKSMDLLSRVLGGDHPYTIRTLAHISELYLFQGLVEKSSVALQDVVQKRRMLLGSDHHETKLAERSLEWIGQNREQVISDPSLCHSFPNPNGLRLAIR